MKRLLIILAMCGPPALVANAHEVRPAYLELRETTTDTYDILWKVPARGGDQRLGIYVRMPADTEQLVEPHGIFAGGAYVERWTVRRLGGFAGQTISIDGLAASGSDVLIRLEHVNGSTQTVRLLPSRPSFVVESAPRVLQVVRTYLVLGVQHILTGADHLLFVLALLIITRGGWSLVKTVTAFTVAHSVTLTAATLGFVHVPQRPVEAVIALSIVFVAAEIVHARRGVEGITARAPWIVALTFGLMHGLGFAGGLSEVGLPAGHIPTALLFFSIGVEVGHFLFIGVVLSLIALARRIQISFPWWTELVPPYAIGGVSAFWVIQRIATF